MSPVIEVFIQKDASCNREYLLNLAKNEFLGIGASVVYIYSIADEPINYPNKPGNVLYIGEAQRSLEPTGKRFAQHISSSENKGGDSGTIYSLSRYYWQGKRIRLRIFLLDATADREKTERDLLLAHVKDFGALPICQGTTGSNYRTTALFTYAASEMHLSLLSPPSHTPLWTEIVMDNLNSTHGLVGES